MLKFRDMEIADMMHHFRCRLWYAINSEVCNRLPENIVSSDFAYNAGKVWMDLAHIPYHEHDAILNSIEDAAQFSFQVEELRPATFMLYQGPKLARALHSYNVGFNMKIESHACIDHSCDEYQFAMHAMELKKWLSMNAPRQPEVFIVPLDENTQMYGFVCRYPQSRFSYHGEQFLRLVDMQVKKWQRLFHDTNAEFKFTKPEEGVFADVQGREVHEIRFAGAFLSASQLQELPHNREINDQMHYVNLEELGLTDC